ncbi:hypothetical protein MARGE09_P3596 [Marinagarivorans cellulosilyticus]|uniref:DUF2971 domain-containing protein n=2 Tax=Marinagarivorans cellulosilyticus TaxID=2721545 RepID=A0AAN2BLS8_9GAMM|nr:hypothetical protein MARGE09_P3596 [Marinagarivorans cellulosilyticus]
MASARTFFEDGYIRLTQRSALNDPFEAIYCIDSLNDLVKYFDDQTVFDIDHKEVSFHQYIENNINKVGVICLSESKDNLLMWAHYAREHKGVVAGINNFGASNIFQKLFMPSSLTSSSLIDYTPFDGDAKPIMYRKGLRYRNDRFDFDYSNICVEGGARILSEIFLQKSEEWIYEKEHRITLRLEQADKVIICNLHDMQNVKIKNDIVSAGWTKFNEHNNCYEINLMEIDDESFRYVVSSSLAELSGNNNNIYLMKLDSSAISHCLFGLNCDVNIDDLKVGYARSTGYLEFWRAIKNDSYYCLEFEQI